MFPHSIVVRYGQENLSLARPEKLQEPQPSWFTAAHAAESKQAQDLAVLDVRGITSFADFFLIATGANTRQVQAIADGIKEELRDLGERPVSIEGYENAEWVLVDYGDFVVHVFSQKARTYYDLERLWRDAKRMKW
jgi:ribosome-associated protein